MNNRMRKRLLQPRLWEERLCIRYYNGQPHYQRPSFMKGIKTIVINGKKYTEGSDYKIVNDDVLTTHKKDRYAECS